MPPDDLQRARVFPPSPGAAGAFVPPSRADWSHAWEDVSRSSQSRQAYLDSCSLFDHVLAQHLPHGRGRRALEVGCYPGGFMTRLHKVLDYQVSGLDYLPETRALQDVLPAEGVPVERVIVGDFLETPPEPVFDLVASFGFIEHFHDPAAVISRHVDWLKPEGWLVLEVPHFRRLQWAFHRAFDAENLRGHNTRAMSTKLLRDVCHRRGLAVRHLGWHGVCNVWTEGQPSRAGRLVERALNKVDGALRRTSLPLANPVTSPFLICIAQRLPA